ncbi:MAG: ChbG/HpnK family deacetylase [Acidobacteria bacterium]|nr:ChbG/HpnK family deacetylase [Acidobacteriota bacterium]
MKYLIVNGDDFGASRGINRGIIEAHRRGILTSTSLIVNMPCSEEAARLSRTVPDLSVGLHVHIMNNVVRPGAGPDEDNSVRAELDRQFLRFQELMGCGPTHLDSHHNVHRDPRLLPHFLDLAREHGLPLREHSAVRYLSKFYGQWHGETHLEQISVESLVRMLETEIQEGITELSCHPGYPDPDFPSGYAIERETEIRTLCDPTIRQVLTERSIQLVNFRDLDNLMMELARQC